MFLFLLNLYYKKNYIYFSNFFWLNSKFFFQKLKWKIQLKKEIKKLKMKENRENYSEKLKKEIWIKKKEEKRNKYNKIS